MKVEKNTKLRTQITGNFKREQKIQTKRVLLFYGNNERSPWPIMPIGLCYVAIALEARGHQVKVVDLMFEKDWPSRGQNAVREFNPEFIGISIRNIDNVDWYDNVAYLDDIRDGIVKPVRQITDVPIMIGGPAVNIMPDKVLEYIGADYAVYGDGEEISCLLLEKWESDKKMLSIEGVICRGDKTQLLPKEPYRIQNLETVKRPKIYKWINLKPYIRAGSPYSLQTKRGCTLNCSYCIYGQIEGKHFRLHDPETITDEIEAAKKQGVWIFEFTDSVFNIPIEHAKNICRSIIRRNLNISLTTSGVNPIFFDRELMKLMEQAGFEDFSFAPDSASDRVLQNLGKGYTSKEVLIRAAKIARPSKMKIIWWFSFGLPGETRKTIDETLAFIRSHVKPSDLVLATVGLRILPGTDLEKIAVQERSLDPNHDMIQPVFYEPIEISLDEIHKQVRNASLDMPNLLLCSDTRTFGFYQVFGILAKRILRHHIPLWQPVPIINRVRNFRHSTQLGLRRLMQELSSFRRRRGVPQNLLVNDKSRKLKGQEVKQVHTRVESSDTKITPG